MFANHERDSVSSEAIRQELGELAVSVRYVAAPLFRVAQ